MFGRNRIGKILGTAAGISVLLIFTACSHAQATGANPPNIQLPADQRAFNAARATVDPEQRLAAMQLFLKNYPKSTTRVSRAQDDIFDTLVKYFPQRTAEIDTQAKIVVKGADKGLGKLYTEIDVADTLAETNDTGVDLPRAEKLAKDASNKFTEADFDKDALESAKKYKYPAPTATALHSRFTTGRANALAALAKVDMDEHKPEAAAALLDQAHALDPTVAEVNLLRGEQALDQHKDAEALEDLERAQLTGELKSPWREKMLELYRSSHGGSDQGFLADMDAEYARIFPAPFSPQPAKLIDGSRTALLELFTGSACDPCVSADLAVDALLKTYSRKELVILAFDQHIPEPDPLANLDSVARAKSYGVASTPTLKLNGKTLEQVGGPRSSAETAYDVVLKQIESGATKTSGVQLQLTATRSPDGMIHASAIVTVDNAQLLQQSLRPDPPAKAANNKTPAAAATSPAPAAQPAPIEPHLVANFALVEDDVRYSGENGIRFHRMVVRSLAQPAATGSPVEPGKPLEATFDPAVVSATLKTYLDTYEQKNDRFGKVQFLAKDTALEPTHLAIAAWVEDTTTHRVLQAAFVPLASVGSQIHQSQSEPPARPSDAAAKTGATTR